MKKNKGFTLIELLAVIVILAVIALIATPIILNMIGTAKKGAAVDSAYGYISALETHNAMNSIDPVKYPLITGEDVVDINSQVKVKGEKPASGTIKIENGKVINATLCINGYTVNYDGKKAKATTKCDEKDEEPKGPTIIVDDKNEYTYEAVVYLNPTDLTKGCNALTSESTTEKKTGCMKWYAYKDDGTNYKLILDHNTTAKIAWDSGGDSSIGYNNSEIKVEVDKLVSESKWDSSLKPTLIKADEVAEITGANKDDTIKWSSEKAHASTVTDINTQSSWFYLDGGRNTNKTSYNRTDGWQFQIATSKGASNYAYLFDYTIDCIRFGCNVEDSSTYGYWTQTPVLGYNITSWDVRSNGYLYNNSIVLVDRYGIRPVITVSKSIFK